MGRADRAHRTQPFGFRRNHFEDFWQDRAFRRDDRARPRISTRCRAGRAHRTESRADNDQVAARAQSRARDDRGPPLRRIRRRPAGRTNDPGRVGQGRQRWRDRRRQRFHPQGDRRSRTRNPGRSGASGTGRARSFARRRVAAEQAAPADVEPSASLRPALRSQSLNLFRCRLDQRAGLELGPRVEHRLVAAFGVADERSQLAEACGPASPPLPPPCRREPRRGPSCRRASSAHPGSPRSAAAAAPR